MQCLGLSIYLSICRAQPSTVLVSLSARLPACLSVRLYIIYTHLDIESGYIHRAICTCTAYVCLQVCMCLRSCQYRKFLWGNPGSAQLVLDTSTLFRGARSPYFDNQPCGHVCKYVRLSGCVRIHAYTYGCLGSKN